MSTLTVQIRSRATSKSRKFQIELDVDKFERLAASFGLFNPDFLSSLDQADKDYKRGRVKKIKSLKQLRKK